MSPLTIVRKGKNMMSVSSRFGSSKLNLTYAILYKNKYRTAENVFHLNYSSSSLCFEPPLSGYPIPLCHLQRRPEEAFPQVTRRLCSTNFPPSFPADVFRAFSVVSRSDELRSNDGGDVHGGIRRRTRRPTRRKYSL